MKIKSLLVTNLLSWKHLEVDFQDGNTAIVGNIGSGKSSIFEIITWVLFKKSVKKTIKNRFSDKVGYGAVEFTDGTTILRKTDEPTVIKMNGKIVEQEQIDEYIGCSYSSFMSSIMCNQKRVAAFVNEKTDSGKAKIFGDMLGVGILDKVRSKLSSIKNENDVLYDKSKNAYDMCKEKLMLLKARMKGPTKEFVGKIKSYEEMSNKLTEIEKTIKDKQQRTYKLISEWEAWEKQEIRIRSVKLALKEKIGKYNSIKIDSEYRIGLSNHLNAIYQELEKLNNEGTKNEALLEIKSNELEQLSDLANKSTSVCPTCGSEIDSKKLKKRISELFRECEKLENEIVRIKEMIHKLEIKLNESKTKWDQIEHLSMEKSTLKSSIDETKSNIQKLHNEKPEEDKPNNLDDLTSKLNEIGEKLFKIQKYVSIGKMIMSEYRGLIEKFSELKEERNKYESKYFISRWLFDNLPMIKLMYIDEHKAALENSINEYLSQMGLPFIVRIDTQKELKTKKEVKDEFSFVIKHMNKKADKNDISGGEEILLMLAVQFAINDLVHPRLKIEMYDEVFAPLDDASTNMMIDTLKDRSDSKQVFIITHRPEVANAFDNVIKVRKMNEESYAN